jgi:hypothetical protein
MSASTIQDKVIPCGRGLRVLAGEPMLDLDDPTSRHIVQASRLMDGVMVRGQQMTVSPSSVRTKLLGECIPLFAELRELARNRLTRESEAILRAIDDYEAGILAVAALGDGRIIEDRRDGKGNCPVCGSPIRHFRATNIVLCPKCDEHFMPAHLKLDSPEGFGTCSI